LGVSDLPPHVVHAQAADRCDQLLQGLRRQRAGLAVDRLLHPQTISHLPAVAAAALVGFAGNEAVARYRITVGRRIGSAALVADGLHARTDGFTSLAVLLGAAGSPSGSPSPTRSSGWSSLPAHDQVSETADVLAAGVPDRATHQPRCGDQRPGNGPARGHPAAAPPGDA
jgi:hypothetical protein